MRAPKVLTAAELAALPPLLASPGQRHAAADLEAAKAFAAALEPPDEHELRRAIEGNATSELPPADPSVHPPVPALNSTALEDSLRAALGF